MALYNPAYKDSFLAFACNTYIPCRNPITVTQPQRTRITFMRPPMMFRKVYRAICEVVSNLGLWKGLDGDPTNERHWELHAEHLQNGMDYIIYLMFSEKSRDISR